MRSYTIHGGKALRGSLRVPGDKSIGHRSLLFAALSSGECLIEGLSGGADNVATATILGAMGVDIHQEADKAKVGGVGLHGLSMPKAELDCGNSGTSMRLLAGLLSAQKFGARLIGDSSLSKRPMKRIVEPLRARGAHIAGVSGAKADNVYPPLSIAPLIEGETLLGIEYDMPVSSAQVKSALLLSGLYAKGPTVLREPVLSRDHTERMLLSLGVPIQSMASMVNLDPRGWTARWDAFHWQVPSDLSSAAFVLAAARLIPGSDVRLSDVGINPTRTGFLDALRLMGASPQILPKGEAAGGEPVAELHMSSGNIAPLALGGELLTRMIDEAPIFCVLAALARGESSLNDAAELRVKESDRISVMAKTLKAFGVPCEEFEDGMRISGGAKLHPAKVCSEGDHRIAMSAAILAMTLDGQSIIEDTECIETSFPGFVSLMQELGADIVETQS
ncbi:MAG: 3-phosphoshikimate 1-carboxyvinyltransferase [Myxococcales bacterium]|nr:MAG: 3-phosphoshikimate 1-carboxyvinyltransferase [Myxococcales bacterium]